MPSQESIFTWKDPEYTVRNLPHSLFGLVQSNQIRQALKVISSEPTTELDLLPAVALMFKIGTHQNPDRLSKLALSYGCGTEELSVFYFAPTSKFWRMWSTHNVSGDIRRKIITAYIAGASSLQSFHYLVDNALVSSDCTSAIAVIRLMLVNQSFDLSLADLIEQKFKTHELCAAAMCNLKAYNKVPIDWSEYLPHIGTLLFLSWFDKSEFWRMWSKIPMGSRGDYMCNTSISSLEVVLGAGTGSYFKKYREIRKLTSVNGRSPESIVDQSLRRWLKASKSQIVAP